MARKKILGVLRLIYCYNDVLSLISGLKGVLRLTLLFFSFKPCGLKFRVERLAVRVADAAHLPYIYLSKIQE